VNTVAARAIAALLARSPSLELFVSSFEDTRRLETAIARHRRRGGAIDTVYDIGAHRGDWTRALRPFLPDATFVLFEGNPTHTAELEATGARVVVGVLAADEHDVDWYATGGPGDSFRRELTPEYADVAPTRAHAKTLDQVIEAEGLPLPDLIKADVQGSELDVLIGGRRAVAAASLVLLECPILAYNEGAPTIDGYFAFMDEAGFTVVDFVSPVSREGRMVQVDVLFGRVS
jgi:FkbM family methyltransferase